MITQKPRKTWDEEIREITAMRKAPTGKFRVLGVDSFTNPPFGEPFVLCDCETKEAAISMATAHGGPAIPHYVYDETGKYIFGVGTPS